MASLLIRRSRNVFGSLSRSLATPTSICSSPIFRVSSSPSLKYGLPLFSQFRRSTFHLDVFKPAESDFHYCYTCQTTQVFHTRVDWIRHNRTCHPESKFPHRCEWCSCAFKKVEELDLHRSTYECVLYGPLKPHIEYKFNNLSQTRSFSAAECKIKNSFLFSTEYTKNLRLYDIVTSYYANTIIVYVNSVQRALCLEGILKQCNVIGVAHLHHLMSQSQMKKVLSTEFRVLVCTDLLDNVSMIGKSPIIVLRFGLPEKIFTFLSIPPIMPCGEVDFYGSSSGGEEEEDVFSTSSEDE